MTFFFFKHHYSLRLFQWKSPKYLKWTNKETQISVEPEETIKTIKKVIFFTFLKLNFNTFRVETVNGIVYFLPIIHFKTIDYVGS